MQKQTIPTKNVDELQELCNEAAMADQREATIQAALALPEAERYRLWLELGEEFAPPAYNAKELAEIAAASTRRYFDFRRLYQK